MLRFLRKYSSSIGVKILYGLLAALFILWMGGGIGGERRQDVAVVYAQVISHQDLEQATTALTRRYEQLLRGGAARHCRGQCRDRRDREAHARSAAERALRPQPSGGQPARRARAGRVRGRGPTGPP